MTAPRRFVPLSVREGGRATKARWWAQGQRQRLALWLAPWFTGTAQVTGLDKRLLPVELSGIMGQLAAEGADTGALAAVIARLLDEGEDDGDWTDPRALLRRVLAYSPDPPSRGLLADIESWLELVA